MKKQVAEKKAGEQVSMDAAVEKLTVNVLKLDLKRFLGTLSTLADEARFRFYGNIIEVRVVGPAHVAMMTATLPVKDISGLAGDEQAEFELDLQWLLETLKKVPESQAWVELHLDGEGHKVALKWTRSEAPAFESIVTSKLFEQGGITWPKIPKLTLDAAAVVDLRDLINAVRLADSHVSIEAGRDIIRVRCERDDGQVASSTLHATPPEGSSDIGKALAMYSADYVANVLSAFAVGAVNVRLEWTTDYPIRMSASGPAGDSYSFMLAPRIES